MLTLPSSTRVFAALGVTDMRKSFDTLAELARTVVGEDPQSGHLFVFCNRSRNRLKVLYFDRGGWWLVSRRLERGTFGWPKSSASSTRRLELRSEDLMLLLNGLDPARFARRQWYERAN
jgi:transposase